jgi:hypothetical protein
MTCKHEDFEARVDINRLEDTGRFMADVKIQCAACGVPMVFLGLPRGLDINGASMNTDGTEGRFAIAPKGETVPETSLGFEMRKNEGRD